ncbi:hypothetical protein BJ138DRAFT_1107826 [Hygrophoropsis aurantiaca]|uniref:Uncharacterized protein n=1 Tax=Hygrophoropsis aurantiaca TaxID=72124 RepID=A0ACB7ZQ91_9AGAM|nr:hypothetical protein BJ138DRAFT_1107826 [Hygrophoropsis aurantiaca]
MAPKIPPPSDRHTQSKNADAHPGKIQLDANKDAKRHTTTKPKSSNGIENPKLSAAEKTTQVQENTMCVAAFEAQMEHQQAQVLLTKPKVVRPRPRAKSTKQAVGVEEEESNKLVNGEDHLEHTGANYNKEKSGEDVVWGHVKGARVDYDLAVASASPQVTDLDPRATNKKENNTMLLTSNKLSMGAKVKNWVNHINEMQRGGTAHGSRTSTSAVTHPPLSTVSSQSRTSKATTLSTSSQQKAPENIPDVPSDVLIGGFMDDDLDDSAEREAAINQ